MANWSLPSVSDLYANVLAYINAKLEDAAKMFDGTGTNLPDGAIRWNSSSSKFEIYDASGGTWSDLASTYAIKAAEAADSAKLGGSLPSAFLGVSDQAADSAKLGGSLPSAFLGVSDQAADSAKLGGKAASSAATPDTLALRDGNGNIFAGQLSAGHVKMSHASGTRNSDIIFYSSYDYYVRKNTAAGFRNSLGLGELATMDEVDLSVPYGISGSSDLYIKRETASFFNLPSGGSWAYFWWGSTADVSGVGVAAGGSTISMGTNISRVVIAWRVA